MSIIRVLDLTLTFTYSSNMTVQGRAEENVNILGSANATVFTALALKVWLLQQHDLEFFK